LQNKIINPITNTKHISQFEKWENSNHFANRKKEATRRGS